MSYEELDEAWKAQMGSASQVSMPSQAPAFLWVAMATALAAWWCWPWLNAIMDKRKATSSLAAAAATEAQQPKNEREAAEARQRKAALERELQAAGSSEPSWSNPSHVLRKTLASSDMASAETRDPKAVFEEAFEAVSAHVGQVLQGPPKGATYLSAVSALYFFAGIVDKIFESWPTPEVQKVSRLRASSSKFKQALGSHPHADELLRAAGFRHVRDEEVESADDVWFLPLDSRDALVKALASKLCLLKVQERQKARGTRRWTDECNSDVLPSPEEASLGETLLIYRKAEVPPMEASCGGVPSTPSARERHCEAAVRIKLNARRAELGLAAVEQHEGLLGVARAVAFAQRARIYAAKQLRLQELDLEVTTLLRRLALPPDASFAQLHFVVQALPKEQSRKLTLSATQDQTADQIASEAFNAWQVKQQEDVEWPAAVICGIGTALDYTLNKGVLCMLLVGYEDAPLPARSASQKDSSEGLRQRAAQPASQHSESRTFGARVHTFGSLDAPAPAKRG
mmetsp:Transcript_55120/g.102056  ORF Transcript_55120/g.102056 Transcript_55120/m.102056 type:complete len:515 (+) Transcript_55120:42-1586(+)